MVFFLARYERVGGTGRCQDCVASSTTSLEHREAARNPIDVLKDNNSPTVTSETLLP